MKIKICLSGKKNFIKFTTFLNLKRRRRKNCEKKLQGDKFIKLKIDYILCKFCGHFNGIYQDTKYSNFIRTLRQKNIRNDLFRKEKKNYNKRIKNIYLPKAKFLLQNLQKSKNKKMIF